MYIEDHPNRPGGIVIRDDVIKRKMKYPENIKYLREDLYNEVVRHYEGMIYSETNMEQLRTHIIHFLRNLQDSEEVSFLEEI